MSGKPEYISLKEAAQMTGYSPDYIGQLIRSGKLPGKQVFSNVAWMTTKDAIEAYVRKDKKGEKNEEMQPFWKKWLPDDLTTLYMIGLRSVAALLGLFLLGMIYVLSVSIDHRIEKHYLDTIDYDLPR